MQWERMREEEFLPEIEASKGVCVIPFGCLEKHGEHLPVGTDSMRASANAILASELEEVCVFPVTYWLGDVCGYHRMSDPGALKQHGGFGVNPITMYTVLEEICEEIARTGFRKILIVNGHGGNVPFLNYFTRTLYYHPRNYAVCWTYSSSDFLTEECFADVSRRRETDFPYLTDEDMALYRRFVESGPGGGHADIAETAQVMAIDPGTVNPANYGLDGSSTHLADYLTEAGIHFGPAWSVNYPNAFNGFSPEGCTESFGKMHKQLAAERLAKIYKLLKDDENIVRMAMSLPLEPKKR